jgi:hypothetical protein
MQRFQRLLDFEVWLKKHTGVGDTFFMIAFANVLHSHACLTIDFLHQIKHTQGRVIILRIIMHFNN